MRRHDLAVLHRDAPVELAQVPQDALLAGRVANWIAAGWPLVVTRQDAAMARPAPGWLALGLTLPAAEGRRRIACRAPVGALERCSPPLLLADALDRLPPEQAKPLAVLTRRLAGLGVRAGVYGSLAWECLTGETYRHAASDIDLICDVASTAQLAACLAALADTAEVLTCGLDGEIRFPAGHAVAWKELAGVRSGSDRVLVKGEHGVQLLAAGMLAGVGSHA